MRAPGVELSPVLPCLDDVETLQACVRKAKDIGRANDGWARLSRTRIGED